ncbi:ricin-type beta-trefoil lectin domain protein [Streptomyces sp. NPDC046866]|uniref:ricin-type beta-trefoil lectin domain protein n=1 Tax=Streptomyces sp. NPDC046866 TaxID=3154921 RepID=UPI0034541870
MTPTSGDLVQAGSLPVSIGKVQAPENSPAPPAPSGTWSVSVESRAATEAANVDGALIKVTPPAEGSAPADVLLDYTKFRDLYGTEWATRLQLKQYPECFLTTPTLPECSASKDVPTTNDPTTNTVRATVDPATAPTQGLTTMALSAASGGGSMVLAASDGAVGAVGSYKATPLTPSGSWSAGGSGGGFSWTYPLSVPPAPAGPTPAIAFTYASQAVDGKTSVSNGQASWVGDGWDYNPGFIERRYRSCADDRAAKPSAPNNDNTTDKKKADLCWAGDSMVMSLGGGTTELVHDTASGQWVPASDDGSKVERLTGSTNGAQDGEYWVVTTRDGMRYHFGRHNVGTHGDGTTPAVVTNSVFTVPVFGNHPGEPCHKTAFADSSCTQAWRWNLDYVEDIHGNSMIIDWAQEKNRYARNQKFQEKDPAKVEYVRGGYPTRILYGLRADNLAGAPVGRVEFGVKERCVEEGSIKCGDTQFESKNYGDKQAWWDTPSTLHCKADAENCYISSPTFWTRKRLTTVTTYGQRTEGSTALSKVDQWTLTQSFPKQRTSTHPPLWLESITRTGYGPKNSEQGTSLPAVSFIANAVDMPNRVRTQTQDPRPGFDRLRVETIRTETGGEIQVDYSDPCPIGTSHPDPDKNTTRCFPVHWSPDSDLEKPPLEWFNKYVVDKVVEKDRVGRRPDVTTSYTYEGDAAWAKDDDEFVKPELRTYSQWRGYASVVTKHGVTANTGAPDATEQSQTRTRYFRGMSGDAGRAEITVKDSSGAEVLGVDYPQFQGQAAETLSYDKAGGSVVSRVLTWPWRSAKTASRPRDGTTALEAYRRSVERSEEIQSLSGGKSRKVQTRTAYEGTYGLPQTVQVTAMTYDGTSWTTAEQTCTATSYVHNPDKNLIGLPQRVTKTAGDCTQTQTGTVLADARTAYDAKDAFGTAPVKGLVAQVDSRDAAGTGWVTTARVEYDALGREVKKYDAAGNASSSSFNPPTGAVFSVTGTNALGHITTTKVDPARGTVLEAIDANGRKVTTAYDDLGRSVKVWAPSQNPVTDQAAYTFEYQVSEHNTPTVITRARKDDGSYSTSLTIYDGLLRPRQTQSEALGGGRIVSDTLYGANGTVSQTNNGYHAEGAPDTKIFVPESMTAVRSSTQTAYDGLGRPVRTTTLHEGVPQQSSTVEYGGDWTRTRTGMSATGTAPLPGSRAVKTTTDAFNRTTAVEHYTTTNLDPAANPTTNKTVYTYDVRGKLAKVTDPAGNNWTYTYDARGRMTSSDDPDTGKSTFTYDNLDQQVSVTDSLGQAQYSTYDALGRKTAVRDNAADGPLVSSWTYDTLPGAKGLPVASTQYWGAAAYKSEVTAYDAEYRPTGSRITVPDTATTKGLAGTYAYSTTYTPTGQVQSTTVPATPGGLAAEKLITRYDRDGMPLTMSGLAWYTADTVYSPLGEVLRAASGSAPNRVWSTNRFDPHNGRLLESTSDRETANPNRISSLSYTYDAVGNPTSITDTQDGGRTDRQCFQYDPMGQLTKAWTGKTKDCTGPTLSDVTPGPDGDGYWQEYEFDAIGNRTKLVNRDLTSTSLDDTTTYTYGVSVTGNGTQPPTTTQPHALTKADTTTKSAGSTVNSVSTYTYDAVGNTKTRRIAGDTQTLNWDRRGKLTSATSPGIGAVAVTGLSGKCLDVENGQTADGTPVQLQSCNESRPQQWRISGNTVQALGKCLTADSGKARLSACNTADARQQFTYKAADKTLVSQTTGQCLTVPNANDADGNDLAISDCQTGSAAQQWAFSDTTTYLYDTSGNRVVEATGSSRTLHLGEAEITVDTTGQAMDAVRYYAGSGGLTTVRRTGGKTQGHKLSVLLSDHHNTATTSIDQTAGQAITRRKSDPYGTPRGNQPSDWPSSRTFLGTGVDDNTTALTHIGAREYDPATGRFISVDPVIDITDPLQMNGYTYAAGNPVSGADPSGLRTEECGTLYDCHGNTVITASNSHDITYVSTNRQIRYYETHAPSPDYHGGRGARDESWTFTRYIKQVFINQGMKYPTGFDFKPGHFLAGMVQGTFDLADKANPVTALSGAFGGPTNGGLYRSVMQKLGVDTNRYDYQVGELLSPVPGGGAAKFLEKAAVRAEKTEARIATAEARIASDGCNSFAPGALVLMADGSSRPIEDLEPGDKVVATDPATGETVAKDVTATIQGEGTKHLVELTINANEDTGSSNTITATDNHPFWVADLAKWVDATDLQPGQWLRTSVGTLVQITAVKRHTSQHATVHNLTVADLHTYYVLAGATPVLVHNCGVTRGGNESTYSISHDASGSGVIADLDSDGILTMMMHNNPGKGSPLRGKAMFDEVMGHFGDRVQGVQGIWVYGDNLGGFNEAVRGGASLVSAAKGTWTGRQAARYGFTRARIDEAVPRLDGDFQQVLATFRR